jgi:hypothetical protein
MEMLTTRTMARMAMIARRMRIAVYRQSLPLAPRRLAW